MTIRLLTFVLFATEAHARGVSADGNGTVAIVMIVLLGLVFALPVVERYVRQWLKRPYVRRSKPQDRR